DLSSAKVSLSWNAEDGRSASAEGSVGQPIEISITPTKGTAGTRTLLTAEVSAEGKGHRVIVTCSDAAGERVLYRGAIGLGTELDLRRIKDLPAALDRGVLQLSFATSRDAGPPSAAVSPSGRAVRPSSGGEGIHVDWRRAAGESMSGV